MHSIEPSWHYALYEFTFCYSPKIADDWYNWERAMPTQVGRCAYVRRIVLMTPVAAVTFCVKWIGLAVTLTILIGLVAAILGLFFYGAYQLFLAGKNQTITAVHGDNSSQRNLLIAVAVVTTIYLFVRFRARYRNRTDLRADGTQLPLDTYELGREFIKGQWRRVCPILTLPARES